MSSIEPISNSIHNKMLRGWIAMFHSVATRKQYDLAIRKLRAYLDPEVVLELATSDEINIAASKFYQTRPRAATWNMYIAAWKSFYGYLVSSGRRDDNPASHVRRRPILDKIQPTPNREDIRKIWKVLVDRENFAVATEERKKAIVRDRAIFAILVSTGMRASEVARLSVEDLDFKRRTISYVQKGGRPHHVVWPPPADKYLRAQILGRAPCELVFAADRSPMAPLTPSTISRITRELCTAAGINRYGSHAFRRFAITDALEKGVPAHIVRQAVGHTSIETTLKYDANRQRLVSLPTFFPEDLDEEE